MASQSIISPFDLNRIPSRDANREWQRRLRIDVFDTARGAGFAQSHPTYQSNYAKYFLAFDSLDSTLNTQRFLAGTSEPGAQEIISFLADRSRARRVPRIRLPNYGVQS